MNKIVFVLLILGISVSGFSQDVASNNAAIEDYWETELTPLVEVNDMLRHIYNDPFKEQFIHAIPAGYPLKKDVDINSFYGYRNHPVHKVSLFHRGIDLKGATGEKAIATGDGNVIEAADHSRLPDCACRYGSSGRRRQGPQVLWQKPASLTRS